jgi:hypothetical protein
MSTFYFEEPVNKFFTIPLAEYVARRHNDAQQKAQSVTQAKPLQQIPVGGLGYRQIQKWIFE